MQKDIYQTIGRAYKPYIPYTPLRLSSRPMSWSVIGADEMARMRVYKASGGSIKEYYKKLRAERKSKERILELDEKLINNVRRTYNTLDTDIMIEMLYISRAEGRRLKDMLRASYF